MGNYLYISEDTGIEAKYLSWVGNSGSFNTIFNLTASYFRHFETTEKEISFTEYGLNGIDLTPVNKKTFNIFYIRCKEGFNCFFQKHSKKLKITPSYTFYKNGQVEKYKIEHWEIILDMLEKDKRYDLEWIKEYEVSSVKQDCMESYQPQFRTAPSPFEGGG